MLSVENASASLYFALGKSLIESFVTMPVVPNHPRNRPGKSGSGPLVNQYGLREEEPILHISPVGKTTSIPLTISELIPYLGEI